MKDSKKLTDLLNIISGAVYMNTEFLCSCGDGDWTCFCENKALTCSPDDLARRIIEDISKKYDITEKK